MKNSAVVDRTTVAVDWPAAEAAAAKCGPRTRNQVANRDLAALAKWLPHAVELAAARAPQLAASYTAVAEAVGLRAER